MSMNRSGIFRVLCLISACIFLLSGCSSGSSSDSSSDTQTDVQTVTLYYTNTERSTLSSQEIELDEAASTVEQKVSLIAEYLQDPGQIVSDSKAVSVLTEGLWVAVEVIAQEESSLDSESLTQAQTSEVKVYFSSAYQELSASDHLLVRTGVACSFLSISGVEVVSYYCPDSSSENGYALEDSVKSSDRMIINQYEGDFYSDTVTVTLYFANKDRTKLVPEKRVITLNMTDTLPTAIVRALIDGPQEEDHYATIPEGTRINDILIEDRVCYIDLSEEFQINHVGGETEEKLTIYSIVDSLETISGFDYIQILIDGKRVTYYKNYVRLDSFLSPDDSIIEQEE